MTGRTRPIRRIQLLLHDACRTDEARAEVKRVAQDIGMNLSGEGHATLSARMPDAEFKKLFPNPSGTDNALAVPEKLKPYIASISEAPEHLSFK
ncbi:hypothetical protein [Azospirillum canadense]|uniref:hypothetical protein n=1 Tax=Azospirillum canadense TaxID=403962 RepID=UPI002225FA3E|nr:hypothetical protein [Azospirillum canadense]MCW2240551.1 hypothetical protein [Azospirillum canadense]